MDKYNQAIKYILEEQELIIGPLAFDLAGQVEGLILSNHDVTIQSDPKVALQKFVMQFQSLFGSLSIEVSKQVIKTRQLNFSSEELPEILK